jgi:hypothetical protein
VNPRSEPLLWLQLIALGALPLEFLLLLLLLAGADPGPYPWLERVLLAGLGVVAPSVLLWQCPADCCSLLLVQVPAQARSPLQRRLSTLQHNLPLRLGLLGGSALLVGILWRLDAVAALAAPFSPLQDGNRLVSLVLAMPVLALLLWHWQQLIQSLWLLSRSTSSVQATEPMTEIQLSNERLCLGLPLLLLPALQPAETQGEPPSAKQQSVNQQSEERTLPQSTAAPEPSEAGIQGERRQDASGLEDFGAVSTTVQPEQTAEQEQSSDLNNEVEGGDGLPRS